MSDGDLGPELETVIADLVKRGIYASRNEVLRKGARLVLERERRLAALDAAIAQGLADSEAGRGSPAEEVFDRLEAKYMAMVRARAKEGE